MKKEIHPKSYRPVVFQDINNDVKTLTYSTIKVGNQEEEIVWEDGQTYPLIKVPVSSSSHPFYTGKKVTVDEMGTIARFRAKYGNKKKN